MNRAESLVPASIFMACSSVEGSSTLSEVRALGLYQYISSCPPSLKRTVSLMFPMLRALKHMLRGTLFLYRSVAKWPCSSAKVSSANLALTERSEVHPVRKPSHVAYELAHQA